MKIFSILFIFLVAFISNANSSNITSSSADYKNGRFIIKVVGIVEAKQEKVFLLLTDYKNIHHLSPKIAENKIIKNDDNGLVVRTVIRGCVWFFCKDIINNQIITSEFANKIQAFTLPEGSNLRFGKMNWEITEAKGGTQIDYSAEIEPDFFVPPVIGSFFIKNRMLEEAKDFVDSVEELAK
jgi:hypothetical protein